MTTPGNDALRHRLRDAAVAARDQAVQEVDQLHGYTVEFSSSPERHREEYDEAEERILEAAHAPTRFELEDLFREEDGRG